MIDKLFDAFCETSGCFLAAFVTTEPSKLKIALFLTLTKGFLCLNPNQAISTACKQTHRHFQHPFLVIWLQLCVKSFIFLLPHYRTCSSALPFRVRLTVAENTTPQRKNMAPGTETEHYLNTERI